MSISRFLKNMTVAVGVAAATLAATTSAHAVSLSEITARGKVKIGVLTGAPPMGMVDEKGNPSGYDVDVANLIGSYLSLPVELVPLTPCGPYSGAPDRQGRFPCRDARPDR